MDIMPASRQTPRQPSASSAPVKTAPPNGNGSDHTPRGVLAASDAPAEAIGTGGVQDDTAGPENGHGPGADATIADNSVTLSFSRPQTDPVPPAADGAPEPAAAEPPPTAASSAQPSGTKPSGPGASDAEPPAVSPAAFAWEMPDPPSASPSSPPRNFLRSGPGTKSPAEPVSPAAPAAPAAADSAEKTGRGETSAAMPGMPKKAPSKRSARQAHLTVARVEPWSVMKFSFVVSLVAFVILFVAVSVLYGALSALGVFASLQHVVSSVTSSQSSTGVNAAKWWSASRILGYTALLGSLNIVLITAMSTIGAVVYNLTSRLVGGVEVTLRETE